ncbi:MAG: DUF4890 domain-containing protein [Rikenellaceae bacterium]|nr:DUF4890 domain-containing protein [Rikenellaceae bacterium]
MKSRIKSMFATAAALALIVSASAQPPQDKPKHSPEERAKFMVEKMAEKLDLTEQQQQQILDLHKEMAKQRGERPEHNKGERPSKEEMEKTREEMKVKMEERKAEMEGKMQNILTPEQFSVWKESMDKMAPHGHDHKMRDGKRPSKGDKNRNGKECPETCECKQ